MKNLDKTNKANIVNIFKWHSYYNKTPKLFMFRFQLLPHLQRMYTALYFL